MNLAKPAAKSLLQHRNGRMRRGRQSGASRPRQRHSCFSPPLAEDRDLSILMDVFVFVFVSKKTISPLYVGIVVPATDIHNWLDVGVQSGAPGVFTEVATRRPPPVHLYSLCSLSHARLTQRTRREIIHSHGRKQWRAGCQPILNSLGRLFSPQPARPNRPHASQTLAAAPGMPYLVTT